MNRGLLIIILLNIVLLSAAQDITFDAATKSPVTEGERFRLKFSVNARGENFTPPDIKDFRVLSGPNQSSRSSMQIINGKVTRSVNYEYYYTLQATGAGEYTIPPATIEVDGKEYRTEPLAVKVLKGSGSSGSAQPRQQSSGAATSPQATQGGDEAFAFLRAEADNTNPYLGEQVVITYKLYYRVNITDYGITQSPSYPGSWSQDITDDNRQATQYTETVNGKQYRVAEIHKEAVFPQRSGEIVTKPMEFQILARVQDNSSRSRDPFESFFNDSFFGGRTVRRNLTSDPVTLEVKPLPQSDKPVAFSGAVGDFSIESEIDRTEVLVNDAINLTLKIRGQGNVKLVDPPAMKFPPDFEVYDPEIDTDIRTSSQSGVSGTKTFKYLIIPRVAGAYTIGPFTFAYFDIREEQYKQYTTPEYQINVKKGDAAASEGITVRAGGARKDIQYLGEDIRYIRTGDLNLQPIGVFFFNSRAFYLYLAIPLVVFILLLAVARRIRSNKYNIALQKERKATRIARKRLKKSRAHLDKEENDAFYDELSEAIWGYLAYKFNIPLEALSFEAAREKLSEKSVDETIITEFIDTLEACEYARFAPGDKSRRMEDLYQRAKEVIIKTEKELK